MAYEYVNIRTDTIDNVKVPTKETLDARTIIESTLEPSTGTATLEHYNIGIWQFPKTGFYKIKLSQLGTNITFLHLYARKTKDDGTLPEDDFSNDNLVMTSGAGGDGQLEYIYILADYLDTDSLTAYKIQFLNPILRQGITWVNTYDKTTQKWSFISAANVNAKNVSNTLTLTKGDTTTVYDGSVAREVSIPTKTSELTNDSFVSYAEQTLTEGQQNQAKTNLGIDVLTGNTTTVKPTQVKEAILAGRPVAITYTDTTYGNLTFTSFGYSLENNVVVASLVATANGQYILADLTGIANTGDWTLRTTELGTSTDIANNYVKYSESQTLTDEQKAQARTNIGAISEADLVQPDWNQNYTTAKDYIKNRICYEEETVTELGNTYAVWNELTTADRYTPISYKMNGTIYKDVVPTYSSTAGVYMYNGVAPYDHYISVSTQNSSIDSGGVNFQFVKVENTVKQIDPKFIPTVSPDWNQNNETAKDYVKNRPGAYFSGETIEITQSLENLTWHTQDTLKIAQIQRTDIPDELYENIPYEICWGNEKYYIKLTSIDGQLKFGDTNDEGLPVFTNYPFFIQPVPSNGLAIALPNTSTPPSSISIKFNQGLVKLSEGYIDQIPGKISLYNITSNICSVDKLEIGVIEDNKFYGVENNQIGYLPTSNGVSGGLALFSPIPPFNQARMTWLGANSLSQFLGNSKSFSGDFGNNEQENVRYNQALSEIHRYSYTLDHCRATIGFAGNDYYNFKLYCDTTTSTKAIPTAIGYTVKNNKVYQLKVTANNLSTNGQVDFVFTEFLDLDTIASKSDIPTIDTVLSSTSKNPVQNNVINTALKDKLQYKGNWQSNTTYNKNDVVYDETNLMYVYTETDATSDPPDINPNCQPLVNIATNVKKGTLGVPNASIIYSQFNYLIDVSTTDSGKYLTVNSEGNPEWGTITAPEESVVIAKLTGAGTTASPYACDKKYNELYTAILAGKYVLMYDSTTKRMLSPYFINIQARLLQFQHVLYEQTGSTTTTSKLTAITVNYNGGSNTLTRTVYSSNIVSSVNGKTGDVITLSASDVGAASSEDLNTLKNSIPEISVVTLDD